MREIFYKDKNILEYETLEEIISSDDILASLKTKEKLTVTEFAGKYVDVSRKGAYLGKWSKEKTPYVEKIQNTLLSNKYHSVIFVGPARCGKSMITTNFIYYVMNNQPSPMQIVFMSKNYASDWSKSDLDSAMFLDGNPNNPTVLGNKLILNNDTFKKFMGGGLLKLSQPTPAELSGKTMRYVVINDYDNFRSEDIFGKGNLYALASKRAATYGKLGCTYVEGSPASLINSTDYNIENGSHRAPPTSGILAIYNKGDRHKWFWPCKECAEYFEASWNNIHFKETGDIEADSAGACLVCPHCGGIHTDQDKSSLNSKGLWVREGEHVHSDGSVYGTPVSSEIASFWLSGVSASLTGSEWTSLVKKYLVAKQELKDTGSETSLQSFFNVDLGLPYIPSAMITNRESSVLEENKIWCGDSSDNIIVPENINVIATTVDVQAGKNSSFVVQVHGFTDNNIIVLDHYKIKYSNRRDEKGDMEYIKPESYLEDWNVLDAVRNKVYKRKDGKYIKNFATAVDTGGAGSTDDEGTSSSVTNSAYEYYIRVRNKKENKNFYLLKGYVQKNNTLPIKVSEIKHNNLHLITIYLVNSNVAKDITNVKMYADNPILYASFLKSYFFKQLTVEQRTSKGWERPDKRKSNEAFDLLTYCVSLEHTPGLSFDKDKLPGHVLAYISYSPNTKKLVSSMDLLLSNKKEVVFK